MRTVLLTILLSFVVQASVAKESQLIIFKKTGEQIVIKIEIANSPQKRALGLMYRRNLPANEGMLFIFPQSHQLSFWMKNTLIPLSIAFINEQGVIMQINDLIPYNEEAVTSREAVLFALEVNQNFFKKNGITPGDRIRFGSQ